MVSASGQRVLVFNGEIYNFTELHAELEQQGRAPAWRGHSDTETLLAAFEAWGVEQTLKRARGMFALALWDRRNRTLTLARDRLGEKPLYYGWQMKGQQPAFLFGSELKALREHPSFAGEVDRSAVCLLLRHNCVPAPYSIYRGISKLMPGHYLTLTEQDLQAQRLPASTPYWSLAEVAVAGVAAPWQGSDDQAIRELDALLRDAIGQQMVADVPLGAFLSGGIDSSTIVALMQAQSSKPVKTFSIGFDEAGYNEAVYAKAVADHLKTEHTELYVQPAQAQAVIPRLPTLYDEPFADSSQIPTFLVSQLAARHVKMVLSGDGGDELFAGYSRYRRYATLQRIRRATLGMAPGLAKLGGALLPGARGRRLSGIGQRLGLPWPDDYLALVALANPADLRLLFGERAHADPFGSVRQRFVRSDIDSHAEQILSGDMDTYLVDDILVKVDRTTMANSLEARAPLLDQNLIAFAARLPFDLKLRGEQGKYLFRKVAARLLPAEVLTKRKQGFAIPLATWFRNDLRPMLLDTISSRAFKERGIFDQAGIQRLVDEHQQGLQDRGELLWMVMVLETWMRTLPDQTSPSPMH